MATTLSKSQFKPEVLAWLRKVEESGEELIITDHGRPAVKIVSLRAGHDLAAIQQRWQRKVAEGQVHYDRGEAVAPLPPELWGELGSEPP